MKFSIEASQILGAIAVTVYAIAPSVPLRAQGHQTTQATQVTKCMVGAWRDVPQVRSTMRLTRLPILVAEKDEKSLGARGFLEIDCSLVGLASDAERQGWRDEICAMAAEGNEAVQNQLERAMGARPAQLCAGAEAAAGRWAGEPPK